MRPRISSAGYFIGVHNCQRRMSVRVSRIQALAEFVLREERVCASVPVVLSVSLVSDRRIRRLNKKFLNHDWATDVLAFPMEVGPSAEGVWILGDVIISSETALRQSRHLGLDAKGEIALYLVHGILHLLGYRDDRPRFKKKMWARQEMILRKFFHGI